VRVAIDVSAAVSRDPSGVGNYVAHLVAGLRDLAVRHGDLELTYLSNRYSVTDQENASGLSAASIYARDQMPTRLVWMQLGAPRSIQRIRPDVCHFPNHLGPVLRATGDPSAVTMHDMSVYRCREYHSMKTVLTHRTIMPALVRQGCWVVAVSESARRDAIECVGVRPDLTRVVYSGVGSEFNPRQTADDAAVRARYGLHEPYVLTVGTLEPRKNHARLVGAFLQVVRQARLPHELLIVGGGGWKGRVRREESLQAALREDRDGRVRLLGYIPSRDLPALYRGADVFAFPSLYEGFGLPMLEALASGVPTLISRDPALREVAADAAGAIVDAHSTVDIAGGLHELLADDGIRTAARAQGPQRARDFSWEACARQTLQIYRELEGLRGGGRLFAAG
jgi:alpha-1,3-rhamnosyl/mannosyltransferase